MKKLFFLLAICTATISYSQSLSDSLDFKNKNGSILQIKVFPAIPLSKDSLVVDSISTLYILNMLGNEVDAYEAARLQDIVNRNKRTRQYNKLLTVAKTKWPGMPKSPK